MLDRTHDAAPAVAHAPFDEVDHLAALTYEMTAQPVNLALLHAHIWNYVIDERDHGTPAGRVIMTLTELVSETLATAALERQALQRVVLHSAVEAYFGQSPGGAQ
jgi:hypothetical protein